MAPTNIILHLSWPPDLRRLAGMRAAQLGTSVSQYLGALVERDAAELRRHVEEVSDGS